MNWKIIMLTVVSALIGSFGQLEFKRGAESLQFSVSSLLTNIHLISGVLLYAFSTLIYVYALSMGQLSEVYPLIATSYIWSILIARVFLKEPVQMINWLGIPLILIGITLTVWRSG